MTDLPTFTRDGKTYLPLSAFRELPRNTRLHDDPGIFDAITLFGMIDTPTVNRATGHTLAGWGRVLALRVMAAAGKATPNGVILTDDGEEWAIPVYLCELAEDLEEAAALALNKLVENGGYDDVMLLEVLQDIQNDTTLLNAAGYHEDEVERLAAQLRNAPVTKPPTEPAPETHKQFVVGPYRWKVPVEVYVPWAEDVYEEARDLYDEEDGDPDAIDLKPYVVRVLAQRLGLEMDGEDNEEGDGEEETTDDDEDG